MFCSLVVVGGGSEGWSLVALTYKPRDFCCKHLNVVLNSICEFEDFTSRQTTTTTKPQRFLNNA